MSAPQIFLPIQTQQLGVNAGLYGAVTETARGKVPLYKKRMGEDKGGNTAGVGLLLIAILITVIIFVAIIAAYDVIRDKISNHYAKQALTNPKSKNSQEDIERILLANQASYHSTLTFAFFAVMFAIFTLPLLLWAYVTMSK
jgi:hypothetical protein